MKLTDNQFVDFDDECFKVINELVKKYDKNTNWYDTYFWKYQEIRNLILEIIEEE